ncbi:MAG: PA2169 family four-helix-bundle protein [Gillisia sp.]
MKTTREEVHEESHKHLVHNLQELLKKNYDAERGFKKAFEDTKEGHLRQFLKKQAVLRNHFATELDRVIRNLNAHPEDNGSTAGDFHRTWIDFKSSIFGHKDEAVLKEVIRGEKASLKEYQAKLSKFKFPIEISEILKKQKTAIEETINSVKSLEDLKTYS